MLRDRVRALREANIYEAQRYRHILGPARIEPAMDGSLRARTSFMVARIMHTGETALFATGLYLDRIALEGEASRFVEKTVILDSRQPDTLRATPLEVPGPASPPLRKPAARAHARADPVPMPGARTLRQAAAAIRIGPAARNPHMDVAVARHPTAHVNGGV